MTEPASTVIIIEDDPSLRVALADLLGSVGLRVESFGSVPEFLAAEMPDGPSCLISDVRLPGLSGLDLQAELSRRSLSPPMIFMTGHGDIAMSVRAMKAGAVEFLPKPFRDQEMLDAVQVALERSRQQRQDHAARKAIQDRFDTLTSREREIISLVATGRLNKQIAGDLGVSEITVKVHRGQAMRKIGAKSVADLVRMIDRLGAAGPNA